MTKTLQAVALTIGLIATTATFAATTQNVTIQPSIDAALKARTATLQKAKMGAAGAVDASASNNGDTYIVVINYTDGNVNVAFPASRAQLTTKTAARYEKSNFSGTTYIELFNPNGTRFWSGNVGYHDLVSVYVSNNQYVVYDTQ